METEQRAVLHVPPNEGRSLHMSGDTYTFKAVGENTGGSLVLLEALVPPQGGPPPHIHHAEDEFFWLLEGELEFLVDGRTFMADAGSFVYCPKGTTHRFKNVGTQTARNAGGVHAGGDRRDVLRGGSSGNGRLLPLAPRPRGDRETPGGRAALQPRDIAPRAALTTTVRPKDGLAPRRGGRPSRGAGCAPVSLPRRTREKAKRKTKRTAKSNVRGGTRAEGRSPAKRGGLRCCERFCGC